MYVCSKWIVKNKLKSYINSSSILRYLLVEYNIFLCTFVILHISSHTQPYESVSRRVPSWSFFPACDGENQRVYIRFRSADAVQEEVF